MENVDIEILFPLVKRSVDEADLESILSAGAADNYDFESSEITEHLSGMSLSECDGPAADGVEHLARWLAIYWDRQFETTPNDDGPTYQVFRQLAQELIGHARAVSVPAARARYLQRQRTASTGFMPTNEELLGLVELWSLRLAEQLYRRWIGGEEDKYSDAHCKYAGSRLRRLANSLGYNATRQILKQQLLTFCLEVDARGFLAYLRGTSPCNHVGKHTEDVDDETLRALLETSISLLVEVVLTQAKLDVSYDWEHLEESCNHAVN
jgi:hypothetical protein